MDDRLYNILCDIEEYLISTIDSDPDYHNYDDVNKYMKKQSKAIKTLYKCYTVLSDLFNN